jgi:hypothetical protein
MKMMIGTYGSPALKFSAQFKDIHSDTAWFHGFDEWAFEECAAYGLKACVEFATFRADYRKFPHLIPKGIDGLPIRHGENLQGICLSNRDFLDEIENNLKTGLAKYSPAGVWLDYMTYGGWFEDISPDLQDSCFCKECIEYFNKTTNIDETDPVRIIGNHKQEWVDHKCLRVSEFAARYASIIRSMRPEAVIGIYMCPFTPDEFNGALRNIFAQDYKLLAPSVDVFTPLIYCAKSGRDTGWGKSFLEASPSFVPEGKPVQLILDAIDFPDCMEKTVESNIPSWGIQMFSGAEIFKDKQSMNIFSRCADKLRSFN